MNLLTVNEMNSILEYKNKADQGVLTDADIQDFFNVFVDKNVQAFDLLTEAYKLYISTSVPSDLSKIKSDLQDFIFIHYNSADGEDLENVAMVITDHNWLMLVRNLTIPYDKDKHRPTLQLLDNVYK